MCRVGNVNGKREEWSNIILGTSCCEWYKYLSISPVHGVLARPCFNFLKKYVGTRWSVFSNDSPSNYEERERLHMIKLYMFDISRKSLTRSIFMQIKLSTNYALQQIYSTSFCVTIFAQMWDKHSETNDILTRKWSNTQKSRNKRSYVENGMIFLCERNGFESWQSLKMTAKNLTKKKLSAWREHFHRAFL